MREEEEKATAGANKFTANEFNLEFSPKIENLNAVFTSVKLEN